MNAELPDSRADLDALLEDYFDRRDRGESLGEDAFSKVPTELRSELQNLINFAEYLEGAVRTKEETQTDQAPEADPLGETIRYTESDQSTRPKTHSDTEILHQVGDYQLLEELGRGGMGLVFKAHQTKLNRTVALKMILSGRMASENELQRFYSEARSVARLCHPNIVSIYDVQEIEGHHFYTMDYIEGPTLDVVARNGTLTEKQMARYVNLIAEAVEYAHQNGILHRDLKPANVLIDADNQPHVTDFGLAKQLEDDSQLTVSGTILGTPSYMSPEQAAGRNEQVGPLSDVYALGAILYFLLTGKPPFQGATSAETISMVIHNGPHPIRSYNPRVSRALVTICEKCLRKNPKERYQSAQELAVELERFLRGDPIQAQPIGRIKRSWIWCRDIPLVAALIGRTPSTENRRQVQFQWTLLIFLACFGVFLGVQAIRATILPEQVVLAAGEHTGMYHQVAQQLGERFQETTGHSMEVLESKGSIENREMLVSGKAHLGFLQASALDVEQVAVVAPLYREFCFVIVRNDFPIDLNSPDLSAFQEHRIVVGPEGSGNRVSAVKILQHFGVTDQNAKFSPLHFSALREDSKLEAAIVVTGLHNPALEQLLATGKFRLLPIPPDEEIFLGTGFYFATLKPADLKRFGLDLQDAIFTIATPALLVVHEGERDVVVVAACRALMKDQWLETLPGALSPQAFDYQTRSLPLHPAAVRFFKSYRQTQRELVNSSKSHQGVRNE